MTPRDPVHYCPRCGMPVELRQAFGRKRPVCPRCGRIHFEDPKVAVGVLIEQEGKVLLVERTVEPERRKWSVPAGYVEAGEDPRRAAARECLEETGLEVSDLRLLDVVSRQSDIEGADILIVYQGMVARGVPQAGDDAARAAYFGPDELPELAFPSTRQILASWLNEHANR